MEPVILPYQQALSRLEQIVQHLNEEEPDVDTLVDAVEEAAELIKTCRRRLRGAQAQIEAALHEIKTSEQYAGILQP